MARKTKRSSRTKQPAATSFDAMIGIDSMAELDAAAPRGRRAAKAGTSKRATAVAKEDKKGAGKGKAAGGNVPSYRGVPTEPVATGIAFAELADGSAFRFREAFVRGFDEIWERVDAEHYRAPGEVTAFPRPEDARVLRVGQEHAQV